MGGADKIESLGAAILQGQNRGINRMYQPGNRATPEFIFERIEVRLLFPDGYLRTFETVGLQLRLRKQFGFIGPEPLGADDVPPEFQRDWLGWRRQDFGRLALWVFLRTNTTYPFTFRGDKGQTASLVEPDGTVVTLEFDPASNLLSRVKYQYRVQAVKESLGAGRTFNHVVDLSDYRSAGSLRLPHKLVVTEDGKFLVETIFDSIDLNTTLTRESFKAK